MRILLVTQYFWPENFLINQLSRKLLESGHQITVITGKPNYPEGEVYSGYSASGISYEEYAGIEVIRVPLRPRKKGPIGLVLNYLSFVLSGLWFMPRLLKGREFDTILVFAISPITAAIPAIRLKRLFGAHLAIWVQDLWPKSLSSTGYVNNKLVLNWVGSLVRWIYGHADTLLGQSKAFVEDMECYADRGKILYYPNSIDADSFASAPVSPPNVDDHSFKHGFSVVFAGNIGKAQAIPTLIKAASLLSDSDCNLIFLGGGSMLRWAEQEVSNLKLTNVHFLDKVDNQYMSWVYEQSDSLLVSLVDEEIFSYTIPSKLQASLAAGRPIVASINGEAATIIKESGAGLATPAEDAAGLAESILKLRNMSAQDRLELGVSGQKYFREHFDMDIQAQKLIEILQQRIKASSQP